ncbi:MAG: LamG-like jellyroll fold domain-containing protein [Paludibacter sp.]
MKTKNLLVGLLILFGTSVQAQFRNALNFHQTPQYAGNQFMGLVNINRVTIPKTASQQFSELTIELWVKPDETVSAFKKDYPFCLISKTHTNCVPYGAGVACTMFCHFGIYFFNNKFFAQVSNYNNSSYVPGGSEPDNTKIKATQQGNFEMGKWYHVAATFSKTTLSLYVNGVLQETANPITTNEWGTQYPIYDNNAPIELGYYYEPHALGAIQNYFEGTMDELRIWNYVRTAQQINSTKDTELSGNESGLAAYYDFNIGNAGQNNAGFTSLIDKTANANHGTLSSGTMQNFALTGNSSNWIKSLVGCTLYTTAATDITKGTFTAHWTAPANQSEFVPTRYFIDLATDSLFSNFVTSSTNTFYHDFDAGNVTSVQLSNLHPYTNYYYRVSAEVSGVRSGYSSTTKVTTSYVLPQTITFNTPLVRKYNDADFTLATTTSGLPLIYSMTPSNSSIITITGNTAHINGLGTVTIKAFQAGTELYDSTSVSATYTINKGDLTVKANNFSKLYNTVNKPLVCSYTGLVNGDLGPDNAVNLTTTVTQNSLVGFYPAAITATNSGFTDSKYNITFIPGDITVSVDSSKTNVEQLITFNSIKQKNMTDADFAADVSSNLGLPITLSSSNTAVASIVNGKVHIVGLGTCTIYADQAGVLPYVKAAVQVGQTLVVADINNALNFNGVNNWIDCGYPLTQSYTKEAWIKLVSATGSYNVVSGRSKHAFWVVNGQLCSGHNQNWYNVVDNNHIPVGTWTHVAVTYDAATYTMCLYTNGILVATNNNVLPINDAAVRIGSYGVAVAPFWGDIDDVKLWNRALNASEIANDQFTRLNGNENGLVAYYDFNSGTAGDINTGITTLKDKSVNGNNGTLYNFALSGSTSNWVASSLTFSKFEQTISFNSLLPKQIGDLDFVPGATSTSGLVLTYSSSDEKVATIVNGKIHIVGEGTCTIYADQSGNASYKPAPQASQVLTVSTVVNNNALNFDGVNDYVICGNILTASYTKEAWIKPATATGYLNVISGSANHAFWVVNGQLCSGHNGNWFYVVDGATVPLNTWTHVAITYDAATTTMKLYKNGVLVIANNAVPPITADNSVIIGTYGNNIGDFNGDMDEVKIWNRALTDAEIAADKSVRLAGTESGLVAYYDFNGGSAGDNNAGITTLQDKSANANNGVLYNFALSGASSNWIKSSVVVLKNQAAPTVTANDINFPTESVGNLANTMEFSIDGGTTWMNVPDNKISVAPFLTNTPMSVQIRYKANATSYASPSTTLILPARPQNLPVISVTDIDYTTNRIPVSPTMQYSFDGGINWHSVSAPSPVSGINQRAAQTAAYIDLTPYLSTGVNLMIRNQPTGNDFGSSYVSVVIPGAPAAPTNPIENTTANTFGFSLNPLYPDLSAYEFSVDYGTTFQPVTTNPITIGSQVLAAGDLSVRVKAVPSVSFAGLPLQNVSAYNSVATALKNTETSNLVIYPNPANDFITIRGATNARVAIYDLKGRMLLNVQAGSNQIDIRSLAKGIYVLKVQSEDKHVVGKLVKE